MKNKEHNPKKNSVFDYRHKTFSFNPNFKIHRLFITNKDYVQKVVGLEFVMYFYGQYFPVLKMKRSLLNQSLFSISKILFIDIPVIDVRVPSINKEFFGISKLLSFECPRQEILRSITKIILTEESAEHFYELKDRIHANHKDNLFVARYTYIKLLFFDMWLLQIWSAKIWLPYISKVLHLLKILIHPMKDWF